MAENDGKHAAPRKPGRWRRVALSLGVVLVFGSAVAVLAVHRDIDQPVAQNAPGNTGSPPPAITGQGQPSDQPSTAGSPASTGATPKPSRSASRGPSPSDTNPGQPTAQASPAPGGSSGEAMPAGDLPGWQMVFSDDFTGNALHASSWGAYNGKP